MRFKALLRKRYIISAVLLLLIAGGVFASQGGHNGKSEEVTEKVQRRDLTQTVLATGKVVSAVDLKLGFKSSGFVRGVNVTVGSQVGPGQILAQLDQGSELAALKSAQGALAQAKANYQKVLEGARTEEVAIVEAELRTAQISLKNAEIDLEDTITEQKVLVENAYRKLLNTDTEPIAITHFDTSATLTVTGTYAGQEEGEYRVKLQGTGHSSFYLQVQGLENDQKIITRGVPLAIGTKGLYATFSLTGNFSQIDEWVIRLPNKTSSSYVANYNAYLAALETQRTSKSAAENKVASAKAAVDQKNADLNLKKATARPSEIEAARAAILSAEAQVQSATTALENTVIRSPVSGTITSVDIHAGEQGAALGAAIALQDVGNLYLESNISEADISKLRIGQNVKIDFDALHEKIYNGTVQFIDPASTIVSGVVNYKIKVLIEKNLDIKPGMTANMVIMVEHRPNALSIPNRAVFARDGRRYASVITDPIKRTSEDREITVGMVSDGGLAEILAGLEEGGEILTNADTK
ncbi:MAG: hypothetical protein A3G07_01075 [Candidatus Doudnabacteria bacterium RIFCSPLOWO2_12_FULL_47_12]|nr:MAG: hypothetical protein A3G07_01075 [Candidatus Doudnabacteria bacterium RIFCSPLOWO2_12_FULL_47_12]